MKLHHSLHAKWVIWAILLFKNVNDVNETMTCKKTETCVPEVESWWALWGRLAGSLWARWPPEKQEVPDPKTRCPTLDCHEG